MSSKKKNRNYEAMIILNPIMTEEQTNEIIERLGGVLTSHGATIRETAKWGRRRLAYEIKKRTEGYYVIYYFTLGDKAEEAVQTFERACRYDDNVLRFMVVNVPMRKRGEEIPQLVPAPGWMSEFRFEPRMQGPRRRPDYDRGGPPAGAPVPAAAGAAPAAADAAAAGTATATESAPATETPAAEAAEPQASGETEA